MLRVLLVDDHKILRQGLRLLLESEPDIEVIGEAADGAEAVAMVTDLHPDVLIADLRMPGLNGIELTSIVRECSPETITVVLSMYADEVYVRKAIQAGAKGYVLKESSYDELVIAIREAMAGRCFISPGLNLEIS